MFSRTSVKVPTALFERVCEAAGKAGYSSPEEFVLHAIEQHLAQLEKAENKELALRQLKGLGYLE